METFTFKEWLKEQELSYPDPLQQKKASLAVAKSIGSMAPDQAMNAIQGTDPQAQKKLVARSLAKPSVKSIHDVAPVIGIKTKNAPLQQFMRKG